VFRFERLREVARGDVASERWLLAALLADAAASLEEVGAALGASAAARVAALAHGLHGACLTVGADSLAAFCHDLERAARGPGLPDACQTLNAFRREYDALRAVVADYLLGGEAAPR
jgi:HPt (histidine-containing phosphotransfer) domain-containing protein